MGGAWVAVGWRVEAGEVRWAWNLLKWRNLDTCVFFSFLKTGSRASQGQNKPKSRIAGVFFDAISPLCKSPGVAWLAS